MAEITFKGRQRLCYTEIADFTDFQGIGQDPLYRRWDSVSSVVEKAVAPEYRHFLAAPDYDESEDQISWHIGEWNETPRKLTELSGADRQRYAEIKDRTVAAFRSAAGNLSGDDLQILGGVCRYVDDDCIYCCDGRVYLVAWGMTLDRHQHKTVGSVIHEYKIQKKHTLTWNAGEHGRLALSIDQHTVADEGTELTAANVPEVVADEGWTFGGWSPAAVGTIVRSDLSFTAIYNKVSAPTPEPPAPAPVAPPPPQEFTCSFLPGAHGKLNGIGSLRKPAGSSIKPTEIPVVVAERGYKFTGWNIDPMRTMVNGNVTFVAQYKRDWFGGWLKWLLLALLLLLGLLLALLLLRSCHGCSHPVVNGVVETDTVEGPDGTWRDDNGVIAPVTGEDGKLPADDSRVAPTIGEGGDRLPVVEQPGAPSIIANRLFLYMEGENDNIDALARDFKKAYPGEKYSIIGYDREVKLLVVQIPEGEREQIRKTINQKIPNHKFFVFDEEVYEYNGTQSTSSSEPAGWHLDAIHLKQGWAVTSGSSDVKVAIVDDGIEAAHPMFAGRIVDAYNVFTQNNHLSLGQGHGTHTAALAAGSADYYAKGASGVAPKCQIMPVQVFDNNQCPLSALVAGVMYAVHHRADVINVSIGPSFKGLNQLPVSDQEEIAKTQFKNVEMLWNRICKLAEAKRSILVFAAGNDDILSAVPANNRTQSAIVVTSVDRNRCPTVFTNYGPGSNISAPGQGINSAFPRGTFAQMDGTSMSAPIVSGTIALMKSLKRDITTTQALNVLLRTGQSVYGYIPPMVLVDRALESVKRGDFSAPDPVVLTPVPDGMDNGSEAGRIPSGRSDDDVSFADIIEPVTGVSPSPSSPAPSDSGTDYDAIRRKIAEYKQKISELEKLLPNN